MRKNIKKLAAVGLTAVLGAGLLAGCGGDGKSSGGKTEITFGIWMKTRDLLWSRW